MFFEPSTFKAVSFQRCPAVSMSNLFTHARTVLRNEAVPVKIAILEISSRASKMLIADIRTLQQGFTWDAFRSDGKLTNLGLLLEEDGTLSWETVSQTVLPHLERNLRLLRDHNIDHVYAVATAAIRQALNQKEIQSRLFEHLGLQMHILSQEEEGLAAAEAYRWNADLIKGNFLLVDQGGGSTEIMGFSENLEPLPISSNLSLQMGTSTAIHWMQNQTPEHSFSDALTAFQVDFRNTLQETCRLLHPYLPLQLIAMGSGVTQATHKKSNQTQHGSLLSLEDLRRERAYILELFSSHFESVNQLSQHIDGLHPSSSEYQRLFDQWVSMVGCVMMEELLVGLELPELRINGLGLRYGICKQVLDQLYPNLHRGLFRKQLQEHSMCIDSIQEGSYTLGKVISVVDFGAFVQLPNEHVGLLHKSAISNIRLKALRGRPIRVLVRNIYTDTEGTLRFDLSL